MGRKVEHALIEEVIGFCQDNSLMKIGINVQKTSRNHQIISILEECGFEDSDSDGKVQLYELDVSQRKGREFPPWFSLGKVGSSDSD
jgi:predicted enzyme involved in methoxymalonyl-ACP biosynthesis